MCGLGGGCDVSMDVCGRCLNDEIDTAFYADAELAVGEEVGGKLVAVVTHDGGAGNAAKGCANANRS